MAAAAASVASQQDRGHAPGSVQGIPSATRKGSVSNLTSLAGKAREGFADGFGKGKGAAKQMAHLLDLQGTAKGGAGSISRLLGNKSLTSIDARNASAYTDPVMNQLTWKKNQARVLIDPRTSKRLPYWDLLTSICLIYVAIVTPFEVAFLTTDGSIDPLFVINRILDTIFAVDMIVQFFLIFQYGDTDAGAGRWACTLRETACNYAKGWFMLDLFSLAPSAFDIVPVVIGSEGGSAALQNVSGLRAVRVLRLLKMIKLIRVSRIVQRWQTDYPMPFAKVTFFQLTLLILFATHWFACVIGLQASLEGDGTLQTTWFASHGYCWHVYEASGYDDRARLNALRPGVKWQRVVGIQCAGPFMRYFASVDWGLGLVTGLDPLPQKGPFAPFCAGLQLADPRVTDDCDSILSTAERGIRMFLLMMGALIWAYVAPVTMQTRVLGFAKSRAQLAGISSAMGNKRCARTSVNKELKGFASIPRPASSSSNTGTRGGVSREQLRAQDDRANRTESCSSCESAVSGDVSSLG